MKNICKFLLLITFFMASDAFAEPQNSEEYCDYYDDYGNFLISFPAKARLLPSGPSALSGIGMTLPDGSEFGISPTMAGDDDVWEGESVTRNDWYEIYMEQDCHTIPMPLEKGRQFVCPNALHALLYKPAADKGGVEIYLYVHHLFKGNAPSPYYKKIMDSLLFFSGEEANDVVALFEEKRFAGIDPNDPFGKPRNFCGKNRIWPDIVAKMKKTPSANNPQIQAP